MENTRTSAVRWAKIRTRILRGAVLAVTAFIICRCPVMGSCFPAAISLIAYMVSRNPVNILLLLPAAAGIIPYVASGLDPWGDLAAAAVCGIFFAVSHHLRAAMWQKAIMTTAITIICISIYRLATGTVYKMELEVLLLEGFIVFALFFVFDVLCGFLEVSSGGQASGHSYAKGTAHGDLYAKGAVPAAFTVFVLMAFNGAELGFLMWPLIMFAGLLLLTYADVGDALFITVVGSAAAALLEQGQWGLTVTVMIGLAAASAVKRYGAAAEAGVFAFVCWALQLAESGVVLGINNYCLFLGCMFFIAVNWKFGSVMKSMAATVTGIQNGNRRAADRATKEFLRIKAEEMKELSELYGTYLDSRSILADQFGITGQIIEDLQIKMSGVSGRTAAGHEKLQLDIAISQCAASGVINGDCCGWQDIGNGRTAMVVSDGMGKGKKAASESLMVTRTIISLLKSGVTAELTLKMINTIMLMKEDEDTYATVDLIIVDRRNGRTKFYKIGAAPTLIRRKNNVEEITLSAIPLGIVNGIKIRYMETVLKKDDWIIMMSDGVSDGGGSRTAADSRAFLKILKETAADVRSADPEVMSQLIMDRAADSYSGRERDDLTVMVARLY